MKQTSVLRVTAEICFYYSVLSIFAPLRAWRLPMALFTAACLLLGLVIVRVRNPAARLFLALLPALCFLTGPFTPLLVFPALAWVYYFLVMFRGNYAMPLEEYRKIYTFMLVVSLFFIAANIANSTIFYNRVISVDSLVYAAVFLVLGVLAMRRMQMGAEMNLNWQMRNVLSVIGFPLLAVAASLILFLVLRFTQQGLAVILTPVGKFFLWLFGILFPGNRLPVQETVTQEVITPNSSALPVDLDLIGQAADKSASGTLERTFLIERAAGIGSWVLLGVLLLVVLLLIWRHARRNRPEEEEEVLYEETETAPAEGRQRRRNRLPLLAGNARQLRRIYKTYLEYKQAGGMRVQPSDTSAEILAHDRETGSSEDASRLRELYIAARYGNPSDITREQVLEAQACLERIVG